MKKNIVIKDEFEKTKHKRNYRHFYQLVLKRLFDFIFCLIIIPFAILIIIPFAVAIKIEDHGPAFYKSKRLGKNFKEFNMLKLRSMRVDAPDIRNSDGGTFNSKDDPRVTKVGSFLRKTSIDELPQLFNIFIGQMSFFGPRAGDVESKETYQDDEKDKMLVKPGLTGYTQAYFRNSLDVRTKRLYDAWYAHNVSMWIDIKIFFKTVSTVIKHENVYTNNE